MGGGIFNDVEVAGDYLTSTTQGLAPDVLGPMVSLTPPITIETLLLSPKSEPVGTIS